MVLGLDDLSMEEVRLNAYEAKACGNLSAYVSIIHATLQLKLFCHFVYVLPCVHCIIILRTVMIGKQQL